jgi:Tfp pilus assembly PilM family ATPase
VARIYLLGSIASWRGADRLLDSLLDIPVIPMGESLRALEQPVKDEQGGCMEGIRPEMVIATGLALRGMEPDA